MSESADLLSQPLQQPEPPMMGLQGGFDFTLDLGEKHPMMDNPGSHEGGGMTRPG